jgi:hypothetical protein
MSVYQKKVIAEPVFPRKVPVATARYQRMVVQLLVNRKFEIIRFESKGTRIMSIPIEADINITAIETSYMRVSLLKTEGGIAEKIRIPMLIMKCTKL